MGKYISGRVEVVAPDDLVEVTLTLDTNAYASGDVLAATQEVANVFSGGRRRAMLASLVVLDLDDQGQGMDIVFLRSNVSLGTENAAFEPADATAAEILAIVPIAAGDWYDLINSRIARRQLGDTGMGALLEPASGGTSLWVGAISRGTGTYTAGGVVLKIGLRGS